MKRRRWKKWITLATVVGLLVEQIGAIPVWAEEDQFTKEISAEVEEESKDMEVAAAEAADVAMEESIPAQKEESAPAENYGAVSGNDEVPEDNLTWPDECATLVMSEDVIVSATNTYIPYEGAKYSLVYLSENGGIKITGITDYQNINDLGELIIPKEIDGVAVTTIGTDAFYNYSGFTGTLVIPTGVTLIEDYAFCKCSGLSGDLVIPERVTTIGKYAFSGCSGLTGNLVLPEGVTTIGDGAFSGCSGLTGNLVLPEGLTTIGGDAFSGCSGFTGNLVLPEGLTTIEGAAFSGCSGLTGKLVIPEGVIKIEGWAFRDCSGFTGNLVFPEGLTTIGSIAFSGCSGFTGNLVLPEGLTTIGGYAFSGCSGFDGNLTLPEGVTKIEREAFSGCSGLTGDLIIPEGVTTIGDGAFSGCSGFDGNLTLLEGLTTIEYNTFYGCSGLIGDLIIPEGVTTIEIAAFSGCSGFTGELVIPESVTTIGSIAFSGCSGLTGDLIIPEGVTTIEDGSFSGCSGFDGNLTLPEGATMIEYDAFSGCSGLTGDLVIPEGVTTIGNRAFSGCSGLTGDLVIPEGLTTIGDGTFSGCSGLTGDLIIPEGVTTIGDEAFSGCSGFDGNLIIPEGVTKIKYKAFSGCSSLTGDLVIPKGLTTIGELAFSGCSSFTGDLIIPKGVTKIGDWAFSDCNFNNLIIGMTDIPDGLFDHFNTYEGKVTTFTGMLILEESVVSIGDHAFWGCSGLTGKLILPEGLTTIGRGAFYGCSGLTGDLILPEGLTTIEGMAFDGCSGFTGELIIPEGVTTIEYGTFGGCSGFDGNLTLPEGVTTIEHDAFSGCSGLTGDLVIPEGVTTIGESSFWGCSGFTGELVIPEGVTTIGESSFWGCSGFTGELVIPENVTTIENCAFRDCSGFTGELVLPEELTTIGGYAFSGCSGLTGSLVLPERLTTIGGYAFSGCSGLTGSLVLPERVTTIGDWAFSGCSGLTGDLVLPEGLTTIGEDAFSGCSGLLNGDLIIPRTVTEIGSGAFYGGTAPRKITVYGDTTKIGSYALGRGSNEFIYGYSGSTAEIYAKENSCKFISLDEIPVVTEFRVSTTQELLDAVGSDGQGSYRHIILADGTYELSSGIYLNKLVSLTLEAENPGKVEILSYNCNGPVIIISGCADIEVIGCILGHDAVESGNLGSNSCVVKLMNSMDININKCDLCGCGVEGLHCSTVRNVNLNDCIIRDHAGRIASGSGVNGLKFVNCVISGNAYDESCAESYAALSFSEDLAFENCVFMNNHSIKFSSQNEGVISTDDCTFYNNTWDGETPGVYGICLNGITWQVNDNVLKIGYPLILGNKTIASTEGAVLPYSGSSLPWKDYQDLKVNVAKGITYESMVEDKPAPEAVKFTVVGVIGGRNVTFSTATDDAVIYYSSETSNLTTEDACVQNGETVLFENFYGTVYARAYANGQWGNVSRLILKIPVVSKPVITSSNGTVTIKTSTPNSTIYYTTDGSTPSPTNGKRLTGSAGSFTVPANCTVKAIAVRSCFTNSQIASAAVTVKKLGAPSFDVKGVIGGRAVTFNSTEPQGEIYYSFTTSNITTKDLHVKAGESVQFENYYGSLYSKTYVNGQWSNVSRLILKIPVVNKPTITAAGNGKVKITTTTPNCTIYYTTDGSTPSPTHGTRINSSSSIITVGNGKTVKAIAVRSCFTNSDVTTYK